MPPSIQSMTIALAAVEPGGVLGPWYEFSSVGEHGPKIVSNPAIEMPLLNIWLVCMTTNGPILKMLSTFGLN